MEQVNNFGLLGKNISYSFSKKYFEEKFKKLFLKNYSYSFFDVPNFENIQNLFNQKNIIGINVTIPYKEAIIPLLDELSEEAQAIGAVNCIQIKDNKKIGHNTDAYGFEKTLLIYKKKHHNKALILGDGGAAKAIKYVMEQQKIPYTSCYRKGELNFKNLTPEIISDHTIIVQCTPVGTFPNIETTLPIPFEAITEQHLLIDLIYNPTETLFLKKGAEKRATTINGLFMLEQQAEKAWQLWNSTLETP